jgi:hypothetical protein
MFALFAAVLSLAFLAACGGGGPANPGTGAAGFTNSSFNGSYVFTMNGQCASCSTGTPIVTSVGALTADGNGNITGGSWDVNISGSDQSLTGLTGSYQVGSDGTTNLTLNAGGSSDAYVIKLTSNSGGYITSADGAWSLSGVVEKQIASPAQPTGTYVFQASGVNTGLSALGMVGAMNFTSNTAALDMNNNGTANFDNAATITVSSYSSGRGILTVTSSSLGVMSFAFYNVDGNSLELVSDDASNRMQGRAELTSGAVSGPLSGNFAFLGAGYLPGITSSNIAASEGGVLTGNGAGGATGGTIDSIINATNGELGASFTGTGSTSTVNGATRDVVTMAVNASQSTVSMRSPVIWFVNSGRGFFLTRDTDRVETGAINVQTGAPYSDSGTYAFYTTGWAFPSGVGAEGATSVSLFKNAGGTISGYSQVFNLLGSASQATGTGTLAFDSGTTIGSLVLNNTPAGTSDYQIYQYSATNAFIMESDQQTVQWGLMSVQNSQ